MIGQDVSPVVAPGRSGVLRRRHRMRGVKVETIEPGRIVITPAGELDAYVTPALQETFHRVIDDGAELVVVDLSAVPFMDSSALGALVGAVRRSRERGGVLRVVLPRTTARRIFEVTALDQVLGGWETREAALVAEAVPERASD